jgi:GNAT superfamily N-acetyltransferase
MPVIRPMGQDDVEAVHDLAVATFEDLNQRRNEPAEPRRDPAKAHIRYRRLIGSDPGGAWVAEDEEGLAGAALGLLREGVWGLSLLVVRPGTQSSGLGTSLLRHAHEYGAGARGRIIMSSADPRAIRAYARLGLDVHPCLDATGEPQAVLEPAGVFVGTRDDIAFTEVVDRHARGAARGCDIGTLLDMGQTLLIVPERGYAVIGDGSLHTLAALDDDGAREVLRAVLARAAGEVRVGWLTAAQQWAVGVCLDAGLELRSSEGVMLFAGDVGGFQPYIPSGAFL